MSSSNQDDNLKLNPMSVDLGRLRRGQAAQASGVNGSKLMGSQVFNLGMHGRGAYSWQFSGMEFGCKRHLLDKNNMIRSRQ